MARRMQIPGETTEEKDRQQRTRTRVRRLLDRLEVVRQIYGRGRFGKLDRALGRKPGFLNFILSERERISLERLVASLDFLGVSLHEFFSATFPENRIPASPVGELVLRKEGGRARPRIKFKGALLKWGAHLGIDDRGTELSLDVDSLYEVIRADPSAAYRMACGDLEGCTVLAPESVTSKSAEDMCRFLVPLADMTRTRGDRNSACDLLDLAFRIESELDIPALRSFIYRTASYLLCDLAYLEEAESYARKAADLATLTGDLPGVGRSLYVRGVMLRRLGEPETATAFLQGCLHFIPESEPGARIAARFALIYGRIEAGDLEGLDPALEELERLLPATSGRDHAKLLLARAEVASLQSRRTRAEKYFEEASDEFVASESWPDLALCAMKQMKHLLHCGDREAARLLALQILPWVGRLKSYKDCQAVLLEALRSAMRGELTLKALERALAFWERPWERSYKSR